MSKSKSESLIDFERKEKLYRNNEVKEYKKVVRAGIGKWLDNFQSGNIKLNTANDLKILLEADKLLQNQKE